MDQNKNFVCKICFSILCVCVQSCLMLYDPMDCSPPAPLSTEFSRQEYWSDLPLLPPADLPDPGIELTSPVSPALAGRFLTSMPPGKLPYTLRE